MSGKRRERGITCKDISQEPLTDPRSTRGDAGMAGAYEDYDTPTLTPPRRYTDDEHGAEHEGAIVLQQVGGRGEEHGAAQQYALTPVDEEHDVCIEACGIEARRRSEGGEGDEDCDYSEKMLGCWHDQLA